MRRNLRLFVHWRTWLRLASAAFSITFLIVISGPLIPRTLLGFSTRRIGQFIVQWGFYASIALFFVAFGCLARRQARSDD